VPFIRRNFDGPVHHGAVHSRSGEVHLGGAGATGSIEERGVPAETLAIGDLGITLPCVVKLDVEGSEIAAIEAARRLDAILSMRIGGMLVTKHLLGLFGRGL
jgi:hypothetical protein